MLAGLDQASPPSGATQVLAALKKRMRATQTGAMTVLANPAFGGEVGNVRELYLAGAISFEGTHGRGHGPAAPCRTTPPSSTTTCA